MADIAKIILPGEAEYDIKDATARSLIPTKTSQLTNDSGYITSVPDASTSAKGIVRLSDSVSSTSTTLAATANAVRSAYNHGGVTSVNSKTGAVTLSIPATPNDYVIAQGSASGWTYRKWSSGVYECWYRRTITVAVSSAWGSTYYHEAAPISYPVTFKSSPYEQATIPSGVGWAWLCGGQTLPTTTKTGQYYLIRPTSASSQAYYIDYYAKGTV